MAGPIQKSVPAQSRTLYFDASKGNKFMSQANYDKAMSNPATAKNVYSKTQYKIGGKWVNLNTRAYDKALGTTRTYEQQPAKLKSAAKKAKVKLALPSNSIKPKAKDVRVGARTLGRGAQFGIFIDASDVILRTEHKSEEVRRFPEEINAMMIAVIYNEMLSLYEPGDPHYGGGYAERTSAYKHSWYIRDKKTSAYSHEAKLLIKKDSMSWVEAGRGAPHDKPIDYSSFVEFGTSFMRPRSIVLQAWENEAGRINQLIRHELNQRWVLKV